MKIEILKTSSPGADNSLFFIEKSEKQLFSEVKLLLNPKELTFLKKSLTDTKKNIITINRFDNQLFFAVIKKPALPEHLILEELRKTGNEFLCKAKKFETSTVTMISKDLNKNEIMAFIEGVVLSSYRFDKYKSDAADDKNPLKKLELFSDAIKESDILSHNLVLESVCACRDLVNEPVCFMNTQAFAKQVSSMFKNTKANVEVLNKTKIESLKMNGLLSVNKGSVDPPALIVIEWKPAKAKNKAPYVFVGKGLVYDTGGINVKTAAGMETMKCDMAGGAGVVSAMHAIVRSELPVYAVGIVPVTDNRPGGNSLVPGDIINYSDGTNVEVLNSDAEGRLILADGILYANKYKPTLLITMATLTGAAHAAIGKYGIVAMGKDSEAEFSELQESGNEVFERLVEFPFWDDYDELIKSDIADIKNIGGPVAGAITAGKFLAHFTKYPFIHLDIAGPSFNEKPDNYRGQGGSGVGVRLLFNFIQNKSKAK